jgi:putative ABC transport system permease protein
MALNTPALRDLLSISVECLWRHRLRTCLNVIGVTIGVAAVVAMMSVSEGARRETLRQLGHLGLQNLFVEPRSLPRDAGQPGHSDGLTVADAWRIQQLMPAVQRAAPVIERYADVSSVDLTQRIARVVGVTASYQEVRGLHTASGRSLQEDENGARMVCVLGAGLAHALFRGGGAVGGSIRIGGEWFQVVGVLQSQPTDTSGQLQPGDHDETVLVPLAALFGHATVAPTQPVTHLWLRIRDGVTPESIKRPVEELLKAFHAGVTDFAVIVPSELVAQRLRTQQTFNIVVGTIAALALLVGGVGIMNTMLASVLERTPEIGLRRTVGASRRLIVLQFLAESITMTSLGGFGGVLCGVLAAAAISNAAEWPTYVSSMAVFLALTVAGATGLVFGLYPAFRAARLEPIDAVRYE